tara:strand:- start:538 stop:825 length:288 start_codon:yes stop_codon:yes gene_type:complete
VRLSDEERERIHKAASINHQAFPDFVRDAVMNAAEDSLEEAFIQNTLIDAGEEALDNTLITPSQRTRRDESCSGLGDVKTGTNRDRLRLMKNPKP